MDGKHFSKLFASSLVWPILGKTSAKQKNAKQKRKKLGKLVSLIGITVFSFSSVTFGYGPSCPFVLSKPKPFINSLKEIALPIQNVSLPPNELYTQKLYARLTGTTISIQNPRFKKAVQLIDSGKFLAAAQLIAEDKNFLQVRVRNFVAPYSSKDFSPLEPFNDLQALMIGVIRDELDARLILTGNFRYSGVQGLSLPVISPANNEHYLLMDQSGATFASDLEYREPQWDNVTESAGAFTTRTWAKNTYEAGTNRRALKNAFEIFLCSPIDSWKTRAVPDVFVRRDVDRSPGGNPSTYQNTCRNCHAIMDSMAGSFARMDYSDSIFKISKDVHPKMNQNGTVYPAGFVTTDDSFMSLINYNVAIDYGWRSEMKGIGVRDFGNMLAQSKAYSRCYVTRIFGELCGGTLSETNPGLLENLTVDFESNGRNLKYLFAKISSLSECISHPKGKK